MAWGNPRPFAAVRKAHLTEVKRLRAQIRDLEEQVERAITLCRHPSGCAHWRGLDCDCGVLELVRTGKREH